MKIKIKKEHKTMAEYIDREVALKIVTDMMCDCKVTHKGRAIRRNIKQIPIADVVEVVRCKDCEHLTVHNSPTLYAYCEKTQLRFEPFKTDTRTHFCSYGKRKEGAEE